MKNNKLLNVLQVTTLLVAVICVLMCLIKSSFHIYLLPGLVSLILSSIIGGKINNYQ